MGLWSSGVREMVMSSTKRLGVQVPPRAKEEDNDEEVKEEKAVIGFCSAFVWLVIMTVIISIISEYVVGTIEVASDTWGISVGFISIILLPIVGNAAEHAGSIIFACKNKLDVSLGVAMGSATQISTFLVPLCVIVAWIMGIPMSLDFGLLQTGCLAFSILLTALTLQDGSSHYLKGLILCLAYVVIGACFFVQNVPSRNLVFRHVKFSSSRVALRSFISIGIIGELKGQKFCMRLAALENEGTSKALIKWLTHLPLETKVKGSIFTSYNAGGLPLVG
ncbi:vacuolar cation/proton exchanger 3-like protein isoform X1 [Tanacetum coccineum]